MPWKFFGLVDAFISRFRVEYNEGELSVAGRPVSTHCPVLILLFSGCFLIAGLMLTVLSYRPGTSSLNSYLRHLSGSHIAGPALLVIGLILLAAGLALHTVARRLQQTEPSAAEEGSDRRRGLSLTLVRTWLGSRCSLAKRRPLKTFSGISPLCAHGRLTRLSKRHHVVHDLLHTSGTNDSIYSQNPLEERRSDVASFPTPPTKDVVGEAECLA